MQLTLTKGKVSHAPTQTFRIYHHQISTRDRTLMSLYNLYVNARFGIHLKFNYNLSFRQKEIILGGKELILHSMETGRRMKSSWELMKFTDTYYYSILFICSLTLHRLKGHKYLEIWVILSVTEDLYETYPTGTNYGVWIIYFILRRFCVH